MPEYLIDFDMRATARITAPTEHMARASIRGELDCCEPAIHFSNPMGVTGELCEISPIPGTFALAEAHRRGIDLY